MPATRDLADLVTRENLQRCSGSQSFQRGNAYARSGAVHNLVEFNHRITAQVSGTENYTVELWVDANELAYDCTCPMGEDGTFCKHCVAVGLTWIANRNNGKKSSSTPTVTLKDARDWLARQDKEYLINLLLDQAAKDHILREKLLLQAISTSGKKINVESYRDAINRATHIHGFVDYRSARGFASGVRNVVNSLAELLKKGHALEVIELAEHGLSAIENALNHADDSDGEISSLLHDFQDLHHEACKKARPDPVALAEKLFNWEMKTSWDTFYQAAEVYAEILGPSGLKTYQSLAQKKWEEIPARKPNDSDVNKFTKYFRITSMMESLARKTGDIEAVVAVKSKDLSSPYCFLQIAEIYRTAKNYPQALAWAERGLNAFPKRPDGRLREFLADEYHRAHRHDDALSLIWSEFIDFPRLDRYQLLKNHVDKVKQWPTWRTKALDHIREKIAAEKALQVRKGGSWNLYPPSHSLLVEIALWENDLETAWQEAISGGCHNSLWLQLAKTRETTHPADVIPVYQKLAEAQIELKNNSSYAEAAKLVKHIRSLMHALERQEEFNNYLAQLRARHKPKRNFIALLQKF
ncbi:MAG TPA: SWIM zinc finger family protein [Verrucomicrobiae bacterium]